jgi:uncharacterized protein (DUF927 family)
LADDWPPGFGVDAAMATIKATRADEKRQIRPLPEPDDSGVTWPPGFHMDSRAGLRSEREDRDEWLCDPFEVLGEARDGEGKSWSLVVRVKARDGRSSKIIIPRASLANGGGEARTLLADAGLTFAISPGLRDRLTNALMRVRAPTFIQLTEVTGWHDGRFVLPGLTIGPAGGEDMLFTSEATILKYATRGDIEVWRRDVAGRAIGNPLLMFALACGFAAPLLRLLGAEGGGFHFRGKSSSGKSTMLVAAGSIWGGDASGGQHGFGHTWRATANALESLAQAHNDTLLCLDEFGQLDPRDAGSAAYMLANGEAKKRLRSDGRPRPSAKWLLLFLSSGEEGLAEHVALDGRGGRVAAGQELRLLDIVADAGREMGIWKALADGETAADRSEALKGASKAHFGHAGPQFLWELTARREALLADLRDSMAEFRREARRPADSGQIARAVERFAVVAAAGELAARLAIVPWDLGEAIAAVRVVFDRWAADFGRVGPREDRQIIESVKGFIERNRSAFAPLGVDGEAITPDEGPRANESRSMVSAGFRQIREGRVLYLLNAKTFAEVVRCNPTDAKRALHRAGFLETDGEDGRLTKRISVDGVKVRFVCIAASLLEYDA